MARKMKYESKWYVNESKWYVNECAARKRAMGRPTRSSAKPFTRETDEKAIEYALWLAKRDGIAIDPAARPAVAYGHCAAGSRPMAVVFTIPASTENVACGGRTRYITRNIAAVEVANIALPNWDFVPCEPVEVAA